MEKHASVYFILFAAGLCFNVGAAELHPTSEIGAWKQGDRIIRAETPKRKFKKSSKEPRFDDADLKALVGKGGNGVLYFVSPRMPLSVEGIHEIEKAARMHGLPVTYLLDPHGERDGLKYPRNQSWDLYFRGTLLHYPSAIVYSGGKIIGPMIAGFKTAAAYEAALKEWLSHSWDDVVFREPPLAKDKTVVVVKQVKTTLPASSFFRPDPKGTYVMLMANRNNYQLWLDTGVHRVLPGWIDPVPTPDGKFLTQPSPLRFFRLDKPVLEPADFTDDKFTDQYQSIAIVPTGYRVMAGWTGSPILRDYTFGPQPLGEVHYLCPSEYLSLPIISKDGRMMGARDNRLNKTVVYTIGAGGNECGLKWKLDFSTGKISFSHSGDRIAFSATRVRTDAEGEFEEPADLASLDAFSCQASPLSCVNLSQNGPTGDQSFPEFLENGQVVYLHSPWEPTVDRQFRVVEIKNR